MSKKSPAQRTLAEMRSRGYVCQVVERWNSFARVRVDLFGFVDVLCVGHGETIAVQATSGSNVSSRVVKIASDELAGKVAACRKAGWKILVHGWRKNAQGRFVLREVDCS